MSLDAVEQLNGLIGFCRRTVGWPSALAPLGYEVEGLELEIPISGSKLTKPDLVLLSTQLGHALIIETKQGGNVDLDQARRMASVTAAEARRRGIRAQTLDSLIVCERSQTSRVAQALRENSISLGVYGMDEDAFEAKIAITGNAATKKALARVSLTGMVVPSYVRVSPTASVAELIPVLSALLLESVAMALGGGSDRLHVDAICEALFPDGLWRLIPMADQNRLRQAVIDAMLKLVKGPFSGQIESAQRGTWNITVDTSTARSVASSSRALRRIPARVAKLRGSPTSAPRSQMTLWEDEEDSNKQR